MLFKAPSFVSGIAAPLPYQCSAHGCVNPTADHYCDTHRATCESCGDEVERGTTVRGLCDRCAARNCEYDREEVLMDCWCGCERHRAGAVR